MSPTGIPTCQSVACCTDRPPSRPGALNSRFCGWTCICQAPSCSKRCCYRQPTRNCLLDSTTQFCALSVRSSSQSRSRSRPRPRPWPLSTAEMVTRPHATLVLIFLRHPCQAADLARLTPPRQCWTADGLTIHHITPGPGHSSRVLSAATAISGQAPVIHDRAVSRRRLSPAPVMPHIALLADTASEAPPDQRPLSCNASDPGPEIPR